MDAENQLSISKYDVINFQKKIKKHLPKMELEFINTFYTQPIKNVFSLANDVMSLVANKQNKKIKPIEIEGGDIKIPMDWGKDLFASFVHIYRNIVDHGLESPEERFDSGKPEEGTVKLKISEIQKTQFKNLQIRISDDGRGIDPQIIRNKLIKNVSNMNWDHCNDHLIIQEIFKPGFSSRESAGEFSGRGVGMDAVRTEVLKLGGKIEVFSQLGIGTTIIIDVPLQLEINKVSA
jgi:two-component system chemotaxis sensor kinase CheA